MLYLLARLLVLFGVLWVGVPLALEAADALAVEVGVPAEKVLKVTAVLFGLLVLANWRQGDDGRRSRRR